MIAVLLFSVTACTNSSDLNSSFSETQNGSASEIDQTATSDRLIYEGVQVVHTINVRTDDTYLRALGYSDSLFALASNLSVEGNIKQVDLCMDGTALLRSLPNYGELSTEDLDSWDYYLVAKIPSLLANEILGSEMTAVCQMVSISDVIALEKQIDKPAILLLEYDDVDSNCVFVSFVPTTNGLAIVNATPIPQDPDLLDLLNIDDTSFFATFSAHDIADILSSVDDAILDRDAPQSTKTKEWFYDTALNSMDHASRMTVSDIELFVTMPEVVTLIEGILNSMKCGATAYDVFYLKDDQLCSYIPDCSDLEPEDILDAILDVGAEGFVKASIGRLGDNISLAASSVFTELCASSMYATELTGASEGTYFVIIEWPDSYTTVTVMRDTGRGAAIPKTHFFHEESAAEDFVERLNSSGAIKID